MTSVEEVLELTRSGTGFGTVTAPRALRAVNDTVVAPRATSTLEHRRRWERHYRMRLRLSDAGVVAFAIALTVGIQASAGAALLDTAGHGALLCVLWYALLSGTRARDGVPFRSTASEFRAVAHATGFTFGIAAVADVLIGWDAQQALLVALPIGLLALIATRWGWRRWLTAQREQGRYVSRTLVVGNYDDVDYVLRTLRPHGTSEYTVVGATVLDRSVPNLGPHGLRVPVLGSMHDVADTAAELGADTIIVASHPAGEPDFVKHLSWQLEGTAAELVLSNRLIDVAGPRLSFAPVDGLPLIHVQIPTYSGGRHLLKRALDIIVAACALVPIALVTPLIALIIKLDSRGPVFFLQERVGRDGQLFRMIKFRSMRPDAERQLVALTAQNEGAGLLFKMKDDPRVTRVGRVLRRLSLDELPQFWNVLMGEMSVVGPRPPLPREVTGYDGSVSRRLYVKPGITGLWQVSGRSDLSWDESVRLDLRYVENWSVMNDLQIMWRTARVMVRPAGAY
ncbi:sugar transferase [Microbacterium suwonense]|uniref:Polyprenyl glycosylphosphotransferase n=1 Tax=Microbacterium suwonense TaxID=683047 RepID=A0ABN6X773_9MICO|nr:sugar transferase [Microbacterium suwonense]BDZ39241.1 polyprenyl glycosylphosphotransferase [Microbacterium suwonense]